MTKIIKTDKDSGIIESGASYVDWEVMSDLEAIDEEGNEIYTEDYVRINNLFVDPSDRGRGLGRALMTAAIEVIGKQYPKMTIKIVPEPKDKSVDFDRLASFYARLGLEVVAV